MNKTKIAGVLGPECFICISHLKPDYLITEQSPACTLREAVEQVTENDRLSQVLCLNLETGTFEDATKRVCEAWLKQNEGWRYEYESWPDLVEDALPDRTLQELEPELSARAQAWNNADKAWDSRP